jgi:hypothetical protein
MKLGLRVFFGFFLIAGLSAVLLLKVFLAEVKPSVREVMEDLMVDTAHLLAEVAADEMGDGGGGGGGVKPDGRLAAQLQRYSQREVDAMIWGLRKQSLDLRIYVTDANGHVLLDSGKPSAVGQDYSQWNDVVLTLRGAYGARATPYETHKDLSTVLVVAAPVTKDGRTRASSAWPSRWPACSASSTGPSAACSGPVRRCWRPASSLAWPSRCGWWARCGGCAATRSRRRPARPSRRPPCRASWATWRTPWTTCAAAWKAASSWSTTCAR